MKQAYELFQEMKPETALSVFRYLRDEQRDVYKAAVNSLSANRKLRPVFIQRKPVVEQIDWMIKNVKWRGSAEVAAQVLQLWLLKAHTGLLTGFLDGLGIAHDGEGAAEDIPDELDAKKAKSTVADLLKKHDPELVAIYLHIFQLQKTGGWPELASILDSTPELSLGGSPSAAEKSSSEKSEDAPSAAAAATDAAADDDATSEAGEKPSPAKKKSAAKKSSGEAPEEESKA